MSSDVFLQIQNTKQPKGLILREYYLVEMYLFIGYYFLLTTKIEFPQMQGPYKCVGYQQ